MPFEELKARHGAMWGAGRFELIEEDRTAAGIRQSRLYTVILGRRR